MLLLCGIAVHAQVLRIGPFVFDSDVGLEAVYTTNVEGERPSEATASREDYYFVTALDLQGGATLNPNTEINLETGISIEKHIERPDLDNSNDPFGKFALDVGTKVGHSRFYANVDYERNAESKDNEFISGDRKKRADKNEFNYGIGWAWQWKSLHADVDYSFEYTRYDDEEFKDGDEDTTTFDVALSWDISRRFHLEYSYQRKLEDYVTSFEEDDDWEVKSLIDLRYDVFERPSLSVYAGYTKDSEEAGNEDWYPTVGVDFEAVLLDTDRVDFEVAANWKYVQDIPSDSELTYLARIDHQISRTAKQSLTVKQQPVDTFGSNEDTDENSVDYQFTKNDLFIYNLNFQFDGSWKEDNPTKENPDMATERTWTFDVGLDYVRALTRKLRRELRYIYKWEDSNLETEILDEHRVELEFIYTF